MSGHTKRGFLLENFRLFHLKSKGGTQVEYHYHEFCKILLLISGSGGYYVDGQRYLLRSGDIVLLDAHSIHRPDMDAGVAAHLMGRQQVRRLPVVENGKLCGMFSLGDLARTEDGIMDAADALGDISQNISAR